MNENKKEKWDSSDVVASGLRSDDVLKVKKKKKEIINLILGK